jgi:hypothetical protein
MAATANTGTDFDLILQAEDENGALIDLSSSDILAYGAILFQADGTEIARYSTNGTALGAPWELNDQIEGYDLENGAFRLHVAKEKTTGLIQQYVTARIMIQRDATLNLDDHHVDNEHWQAGEKEVLQLIASLDDSVINMI